MQQDVVDPDKNSASIVRPSLPPTSAKSDTGIRWLIIYSLCSWFPYLITLGIEYLDLKSAACFTRVKGLQPPKYPSVTHCMHNWLVLNNCENSHITIIFIWTSQLINFEYTKAFASDIQHVEASLNYIMVTQTLHLASIMCLYQNYTVCIQYTVQYKVYQKNAS